MKKYFPRNLKKPISYMFNFVFSFLVFFSIYSVLVQFYPDETNLAVTYFFYYVLLFLISFGGVVVVWTIYEYSFVKPCFYLIRRRVLIARRFRIFQLCWHGSLAFYGYAHIYCVLAKVDFPLFGFYYSV